MTTPENKILMHHQRRMDIRNQLEQLVSDSLTHLPEDDIIAEFLRASYMIHGAKTMRIVGETYGLKEEES